MIAHNKWLPALGFFASLSTTVMAEEPGEVENEDAPWSFELGIGIESEPVYTGSDVMITEPELNLEVAYEMNSGHSIYGSLGEIGVVWQLSPQSILATAFEFETGRDNSEDPILSGFPTVENTVEAQVIFRQQVGEMGVGAGIQYDVLGRGKGLVGFIGIDYAKVLSSKLSASLQFDLSFADAEHMQTEVGISPATATATATSLSAFDAAAGYKGASMNIGFQYAIGHRWQLYSQLGIEHYGSIMSDSPLISKEGTPTTFEGALGIAYQYR